MPASAVVVPHISVSAISVPIMSTAPAVAVVTASMTTQIYINGRSRTRINSSAVIRA